MNLPLHVESFKRSNDQDCGGDHQYSTDSGFEDDPHCSTCQDRKVNPASHDGSFQRSIDQYCGGDHQYTTDLGCEDDPQYSTW